GESTTGARRRDGTRRQWHSTRDGTRTRSSGRHRARTRRLGRSRAGRGGARSGGSRRRGRRIVVRRSGGSGGGRLGGPLTLGFLSAGAGSSLLLRGLRSLGSYLRLAFRAYYALSLRLGGSGLGDRGGFRCLGLSLRNVGRAAAARGLRGIL